jgi:glycosyltransferase involved in cell wall biosynthesis
VIVNKIPVFSVIIPLYNSEKHIKNTIQSVLNQTYDSWELIVVDDCSTDNSREIVREIERNDRRIRLITSDKNFGGPAKPRNIGIKSSQGKYIAFLDSDDIWYSDKLDVCLQCFNDSVDVVYHDLVIFGNKRKYFRNKLRGRKLKVPVLEDLLVNGNGLNNSSVVVRHEIIKKVNYIDESKDVIAAEDFNLWLKIASISQNFKYISSDLGGYYVGDNNISSKNMSTCLRFAADEFAKQLSYKQFLRYESIVDYTNGRYLYLNKEYMKSVEYLIKVLSDGGYKIKIKSMYMLCIIYFRRIKL